VRFGIISDIHGNFPALQAVLEALDHQKVAYVFCAGDVVGYGPHPEKCIRTVQRRGITCVRGNHDQYVIAEEKPTGKFSHPSTVQAIEWTRENLSDEAKDWLAGLPFQYSDTDFEIVHASHVINPKWMYVTDIEKATLNFMFQEHRVSFNGHTHVPLLAERAEGSAVRFDYLRTMYLDADKQYLIGAGAVGQPRDKDPRACALLLDTEEQHVQVLRVPYALQAVQEDIITAGLPSVLGERLEAGK